MSALHEGPVPDRITVHRDPERARYARADIDAVLAEGVLAHVGFEGAHGVVVIPMVYAPCPGGLFLHGSPGSGLVRALKSVPACATVTLLDGLVVARSAFMHSMNYRSVVAFGQARRLDGDEKVEALDTLVEHLLPGRTAELRRPTREELNQTAIVHFAIEEASMKTRTGGPADHDEDVDPEVWAGWIPTPLYSAPAVPADDVRPGLAPPPSVSAFVDRHSHPARR